MAADGPKLLGREQLLDLPESKVNSGYAICLLGLKFIHRNQFSKNYDTGCLRNEG